MAWVVDHSAENLRDSALRLLNSALNQAACAEQRITRINGGTRTVIGSGHSDGDLLIQYTAEAGACLQRAESSILRSISETSGVNIMMWVDDD